MSNISSPTESGDVDHDKTTGGTDGNPHADSASATDVQNHTSDASAHHAKTTSAADLTDVSPDSTAGAHHSRYTDSEASNAAPVDDVNGQTGSVNVSTPTMLASGEVATSGGTAYQSQRVELGGDNVYDGSEKVLVQGYPYEDGSFVHQIQFEVFTL